MNVPDFLAETVFQLQTLDRAPIYKTVKTLEAVRSHHARVFCIGNGGGAAHALHFAADLRKIGGIEAYAWGENQSDLTAWVNDDSWVGATSAWINASRPTKKDALFLFSVGGGDTTTSANLMEAVCVFPGRKLGVVGHNPDGFVQKFEMPVIILSTRDTCLVEGIQSVLAHAIVEQLRCG